MPGPEIHNKTTEMNGLTERKEKKNYVGRENSRYINQGKGDTLTPQSRESPPPQSSKTNRVNGGLDGLTIQQPV
eukprot:340054-Pelagomonas_calceolata.AAC.1